MPDVLQEYRREAEKQYGLAIVRLIALGQQKLDLEALHQTGLTQGQQTDLERIAVRIPSSTEAELQSRSIKLKSIEIEVCYILLCYLQTVRLVRDQNLSLIGLAILENEQQRWNLSSDIAEDINAVILPNYKRSHKNSHKSDRKTKNAEKWEQYYQLLFKAIQQDGIPLKENIQAQLKLLQLQLGMPDGEVPAAEQLQSKRGVNYIRLWQLLKEGKWYDANQETRRCLVEAGGQQQRDLQLIDVDRIDVVDLQTIDALWSEFSKQRFGFKIQRKIWVEIDPQMEDLEALGKKLDWRRNHSWISYESADFSKDAVLGHLPIFPHIGWWCWVGSLKAILDRFPVEDAKPVR
jgi:hypothetical protein